MSDSAAPIDTLPLPMALPGGATGFWETAMAGAADWLRQRGLASRDAVVLLPFAQQLASARRAWRGTGLWPPRMETTHSLASALGPSPLSQGMEISFDAAVDALNARQLLAQQSWAQALAQADARAFRLALGRLTELAQHLLRHAHTLAPASREAFWDQARQAFVDDGLGQLEQALSLVALEWAASDSREPATDALFAQRPSAWVVLQAGGADPLCEALLAHAAAAGVPCLRLLADSSLEALAQDMPSVALAEAVCEDREALAQATAAAVLAHLQAGQAPVALVAQDRVLVRRVRALLERQALRLGDETGWTLATTAEAAQLMAWMRAAQSRATVDELLSALKGTLGQALCQRHDAQALSLLEASCRRQGWVALSAVHAERLPDAAAALWAAAQDALAALRKGATQRPLQQWLQQLQRMLQQLDGVAVLQQQPAGQQLLMALWLQRAPWPGSAHEQALQHSQLNAQEFMAWVDDTLEAQQFVPQLPAQLQVLITPMARAMLRPFGAVVLPGADAQTLGGVAPGCDLLPDPVARALAMPDQAARRLQLAQAFAQLLRAPALTLLRCDHAGAEPLAPSPLLLRLQAARRAAGLPPIAAWQDPRSPRLITLKPTERAEATAAQQLPRRLSASTLEALRNCPYQFYALHLLGLRTADELLETLDKSDYGNWLHALLHQFHAERAAQPAAERSQDPAVLLQALWDAAHAQRQRLALAEAEFLPYVATAQRLFPRYVSWLLAHEQQGWEFAAGEEQRSCQPWADAPGLAGLELMGRLDRRDARMQQGRPQALLLDYKSGNPDVLRRKVKDSPLEDTQLGVYALLCGAMQEEGEAAPLQAAYLALNDGSEPLALLAHEDIEDVAQQLRSGLAQDLAAVQGGAALKALGQGAACGYCVARGLCRKDDWWEGGC
ncbi:PD-(D/E)XK nuclease family protein [Roseateles sp. BYS180W]|uniref:PD-(D/E)XK nuclease family protein n=1 Tax=Roseateles rivi TaxID=3299028 RepID=A0ABW7FZ18_9BURK